MAKKIGKSDTVPANPTKRFFVSMLTRDIELEDAVLDLLDNCIDGVVRSLHGKVQGEEPYKEFEASINFNENRFVIKDNCGGIPLKLAREYAFMMGRPEDSNGGEEGPTVGIYGIGMKRAVFKMGQAAEVHSQTATDSFNVTISKSWLHDDKDWDLPLTEAPRTLPENGTAITIKDIYPTIKERFFSKDAPFYTNFTQKVSHQYSFIIQKGFRVRVNGKNIPRKPFRFLLTTPKQAGEEHLAPYLYEGESEGVKIRIAVGFYRPTPDENEIEDEAKSRHSAEEAGWTVICNDRIVLFCDKTRLSGWGEADVPSFHNQFIAISGVVHFQSDSPLKLPMNTTKRGIDAASPVYLYAKNFMREGTKLFTTYTNRWKKNLDQERSISSKAEAHEFPALWKNVAPTAWAKVKNQSNERRFQPKLPQPKSTTQDKVIHFSRPNKDVRTVAEYLFDNPETAPSEVGAECFDQILKKAKK